MERLQKIPPVFCYCVIVKVRLTLWVETVVPDVPVATTVIWEVVGAGVGAGGAGVVLVPLLLPKPLLEPQPDRPAAKAHAQTSSKQSCQELCLFCRIRSRMKIANPVRPPGHQKARANKVGLSGLCRVYFSASCVDVMLSATLTPWSRSASPDLVQTRNWHSWANSNNSTRSSRYSHQRVSESEWWLLFALPGQ